MSDGEKAKRTFEDAPLMFKVELALKWKREAEALEKKLEAKRELLKHAMKDSHVANVVGMAARLAKKTEEKEATQEPKSTSSSRVAKKRKLAGSEEGNEQSGVSKVCLLLKSFWGV